MQLAPSLLAGDRILIAVLQPLFFASHLKVILGKLLDGTLCIVSEVVFRTGQLPNLCCEFTLRFSATRAGNGQRPCNTLHIPRHHLNCFFHLRCEQDRLSIHDRIQHDRADGV